MVRTGQRVTMGTSAPSPPEWVTLDSDERVWLRATPSSNLVLASLAVGFVLLIAMSVLVSFFTDLATGRVVSFAVLVLIVALLVAAYAVTKRREYVLTSERAYAGVGLTEKRVSSVELTDVREVTVEQSDWERVLNVGSLRFVTDGDSQVTFALVENPAHVYQQVRQFVDGEAETGTPGV